MTSGLSGLLSALDTRIKRLEENIGDVSDSILNFLSVKEKIKTTEYITISKRVINGSFMLGVSKTGDALGDCRGAPVVVWEGEGS